MEILTLGLIIICAVMAGAGLAIVWVYVQMRAKHLADIAELAKVKADFTDTIAKAAEVSNGWAAKFIQMQDQLLAHEMVLKGSKRA